MSSDFPSAVIAFFVVLIPLILIHELGHFLTAKRVGITILEFAIGFPPRIVKLFNWGETEFTLNWIPLGGYVRPLGEDMVRPLDAETVEKDREALIAQQQADQNEAEKQNPLESERAQAKARGVKNPKTPNEVPPLSRIFFLAGGALANFALAFVLFFIIAVTGIPQSVGASVGVLKVEPDSVLAQAGLQSGDIIMDVNGAKFADSESFFDTYYKATEPLTVTVSRGQQNEKIQLTIPPPTGLEQTQQAFYVQILGIVPDAPGAKAGILPGDVVIALNGQSFDSTNTFRELISENAGKDVTMTLRRGDETLDVTLQPRKNPPEGQGAVGISISDITEDLPTHLQFIALDQQDLVPQPLLESARYGVDRVFSVISMTVQVPVQLLNGKMTPEQARPVSVIGMSQIGADILRQSVEQQRLAPILDFIAVISVALGFFNLLPIPALDGGRILFVLVEVVRGRPIAPEREGIVHLVGLVLLLSLSVLIILNDVVNPINLLR